MSLLDSHNGEKEKGGKLDTHPSALKNKQLLLFSHFNILDVIFSFVPVKNLLLSVSLLNKCIYNNFISSFLFWRQKWFLYLLNEKNGFKSIIQNFQSCDNDSNSNDDNENRYHFRYKCIAFDDERKECVGPIVAVPPLLVRKQNSFIKNDDNKDYNAFCEQLARKIVTESVLPLSANPKVKGKKTIIITQSADNKLDGEREKRRGIRRYHKQQVAFAYKRALFVLEKETEEQDAINKANCTAGGQRKEGEEVACVISSIEKQVNFLYYDDGTGESRAASRDELRGELQNFFSFYLLEYNWYALYTSQFKPELFFYKSNNINNNNNNISRGGSCVCTVPIYSTANKNKLPLFFNFAPDAHGYHHPQNSPPGQYRCQQQFTLLRNTESNAASRAPESETHSINHKNNDNYIDNFSTSTIYNVSNNNLNYFVQHVLTFGDRENGIYQSLCNLHSFSEQGNNRNNYNNSNNNNDDVCVIKNFISYYNVNTFGLGSACPLTRGSLLSLSHHTNDLCYDDYYHCSGSGSSHNYNSRVGYNNDSFQQQHAEVDFFIQMERTAAMFRMPRLQLQKKFYETLDVDGNEGQCRAGTFTAEMVVNIAPPSLFPSDDDNNNNNHNNSNNFNNNNNVDESNSSSIQFEEEDTTTIITTTTTGANHATTYIDHNNNNNNNVGRTITSSPSSLLLYSTEDLFYYFFLLQHIALLNLRVHKNKPTTSNHHRSSNYNDDDENSDKDVTFVATSRIISVTGSAVEFRFFYMSRNNCVLPKVLFKLVATKNALLPRQMVNTFNNDIAYEPPAKMNNSNNYRPGRPRDSDSDSSASESETDGNTFNNSNDNNNDSKQTKKYERDDSYFFRHEAQVPQGVLLDLFTGSYGRVELHRPPEIHFDNLKKVKKLLGLPTSFPHRLMWNIVLACCGGAGAAVLQEHFFPLLSDYNQTFVEVLEDAIRADAKRKEMKRRMRPTPAPPHESEEEAEIDGDSGDDWKENNFNINEVFSSMNTSAAADAATSHHTDRDANANDGNDCYYNDYTSSSTTYYTEDSDVASSESSARRDNNNNDQHHFISTDVSIDDSLYSQPQADSNSSSDDGAMYSSISTEDRSDTHNDDESATSAFSDAA